MVEAHSQAVVLRIPPLLLGLATLLWGSQQMALTYAVVMAAVIEFARYARFAWDFSDRDFHRLADLSTIGLLLLVVVEFSDHGLSGIYGVLRWFPVVLLGLVLGQCYSTRGAVKLSALFLSVRFALIRGRIKDPGQLDMRVPYLVACLLSASTGPQRNVVVVPLAALTLVWLLLANRPLVRSKTAVVLSLGACVVVALLAQHGVTLARRAIEPFVMEMVRDRLRYWRDPFRQQTAIGDIGELKVSNRIVLRVEVPPGTSPPQLLREASYTQYNNSVWFARDRTFTNLESKAVGTRWDLAGSRQPFKVITISRSLYRNRGMLALPNGSFRIDDLPVEELKQNKTGAVKVVNGPDLIRYQVRYNERYSTDAAPGSDDLLVPERLRKGLRNWLFEQQLPGKSKAEFLVKLRGVFNHKFRYSLKLRGRRLLSNPVLDFLQHSRSGHCEYFATATVLLLRTAGIPARYASGFMVNEYSSLEERYLVRRRQAHSWAQVWLQGRWHDFDTTPSVWFEAEQQKAPWWQSSYDLVSMWAHAWSLWRLTGDDGKGNSPLVWLLPVLVVILIWRVSKSRRIRRDKDAAPVQISDDEVSETDTGFSQIEQAVARRRGRRPPGLPEGLWLRALLVQQPQPDLDMVYQQILPLYQRLRFHPGGLNPQQRRDLNQLISDWLARFAEKLS